MTESNQVAEQTTDKAQEQSSADGLEEGRIRVALKRPGGFALDVDIAVRAGGGVTTLFGPSGCGKTTVLRSAAGLEHAHGLVRIAGHLWQDDAADVFVPTCERRLGYVFQEASLFPHLDVEQNISYGLKRRRDPKGRERLAEAVELLGIGGLLKRRPAQLSGGERQRCAIARALASRPEALFMDEPLAALDHARRLEIMPWLERIKRELNIPVIYVTHSEEEVLRLADDLVVMEAGRVVDAGPVARVWHDLNVRAGNRAARSTLVVARVTERDARWGLVKVVTGGAWFWVRDHGGAIGSTVRLMIEADNVSLSVGRPSQTSIQNVFCCRAKAILPGRDEARRLVELDAGETTLLAEVTARAASELALEPGMTLWAQVKSVAVH